MANDRVRNDVFILCTFRIFIGERFAQYFMEACAVHSTLEIQRRSLKIYFCANNYIKHSFHKMLLKEICILTEKNNVKI